METILLVDDERDILTVTREMLETEGYQVLEAVDAEGALRIAGSFPGSIHLLLTDVVMPGMNGQELAQEIGRERPETKILFMTGFSFVKVQFSDETGLKPGAPLIVKPFTLERLSQKVRESLAVRPSSPFDKRPDLWDDPGRSR